MMKMLLDNGADIDSRNKNLETPLLTAARKVGTGAEAGRQAGTRARCSVVRERLWRVRPRKYLFMRCLSCGACHGRQGCMKSVLWLAEHQADMGALDRQRRAYHGHMPATPPSLARYRCYCKAA